MLRIFYFSVTEECWPDPKSKSLLSSKNNNGTIVAFPNNAIPSCDKWANSVPYVNPAAPRSNCPSGMVPSSGTTTASTFVSITAKSSTSDQAPVIPVRNGSATNNSSVAVRVAKTNGAPSIPMELQAKSDALKKIKVLSPPQALSQFQLVPEFNDPLNRDGAYSIRLVRLSIFCIVNNMGKANRSNYYYYFSSLCRLSLIRN